VRNINGWSEFSDVTYISPALQPEAPPKPKFITATDTTISLEFERSPDDNGIPITDYQLFIDAGDDFTSSYHQVASYTGTAMSFVLDKTRDSLGLKGTLYRAKFRAVNEKGQLSDFSPVL
jgi:hypothetical protein